MSIATERRSNRRRGRVAPNDAQDVQGASMPVESQWNRTRTQLVRIFIWVLVLAAMAGGAWSAQQYFVAEHGPNRAHLILHAVSRKDLAINVSERGNLESQANIKVYCEVDDVRKDGINGTPIVWIIPNGTSVKEGDLLVELDSAALREYLDVQTLATQQAEELCLLAQAKYDNQKSRNETAKAESELTVQLAKLELRMFQDTQSGTHKLEVEEIKRSIDDLNNDILAAQANLELKRNDRDGIEALFKLGYAGKSECERCRLDFLQAESSYAANINRMKTLLAKLTRKETYEKEMEQLKLDGKFDTAERSLTQVVRNNDAEIAHAKASMEARTDMLKKEQERLALYQKQFDKCKIYAPSEGMVAYAVSREGEIREGANVRMRQRILSIPNLKHMQVKTSVHESVLDQIKPGMPASVTVESFSDQSFAATVKSVAVLPEHTSYYSYSQSKVYQTVVEITDEVERLKPGMTAIVEIHVDRLEKVLTLPVQAVTKEDKQVFCFVNTPDGRIERRTIEVGVSNELEVHVIAGIEEGEQVVLNPTVLLDQIQSVDLQPPASSTKAAKGKSGGG
ncbi:MAG: efflux RND transporter periplasmic adaptor subunit [Pirellulaceae bacterium]